MNPDRINTGAQGVSGVGVNGSDVYLELWNGGRLRIDGAAGKDFDFENDYATVIAQISDGDLTYDGRADYFYTTTKSRAKLEVSSEVDNAEVWLNNGRSGEFHGNIYELDGSAVEGNATLVGNDFDNVIAAGKGNNSLWGGNNGNDSLIGGAGVDTFFFFKGSSNDTISGAGANDTVNLYGITLDDFAVTGADLFDGDNIVAKFKNGETLTIENGKNSGAAYVYGGTTWAVENGSWVQK